MFALAVCSCAAPFAARLQVEAHASTPQIAQRADILPSRSVVTLNHDENTAEAAFFEAIEQPLALPVEPTENFELAMQQAVPSTIEPVSVSESPIEVHVAPSVNTYVSELSLGLNYDLAPNPDISDTPPPSEPAIIVPILKPSPEERALEITSPIKTPIPIFRDDDPKIAEGTNDKAIQRDTEVSSNDAKTDYPDIVEALLDPLEEATPPIPRKLIAEAELIEPTAFQQPLNPTRPIETVALAFENNAEVLVSEPTQSDVVQDEIFLPEPVTPVVAKPVRPAPQPAPVLTAQLPIPQTARPAPAPARPPVRLQNGPKIALVIAAAGFNTNVTRFAIEKLPAGITLAFAPVKNDVASLAREAKADGHTVLVEIPMEPVNRNRDPGPLTLRAGDTAQDNIARLNQALARVPVADGASSYLGARFNADARAATPIVQALAQKGLVFFENEPTSRSVFQRLSATSRLPYARGIVKIDRGRGSASIREALDTLERQARQQGQAIGVGTTLRGTISTVALWAKAAEKRGVQFVPITELTR